MNVEFLSYDEWLNEVNSEDSRISFRHVNKRWDDELANKATTVRVAKIYSRHNSGWFSTSTVLDRIKKLQEFIEEHKPLRVAIFDWDDYLRFEAKIPDDRTPEEIQAAREHFLKMEYSEYLKRTFSDAGLEASNDALQKLYERENNES